MPKQLHTRKRRRPNKDPFSWDWTNFHSMSLEDSYFKHPLAPCFLAIQISNTKEGTEKVRRQFIYFIIVHWLTAMDRRTKVLPLKGGNVLAYNFLQLCPGVATAEGLAIINITAAAIKMKCKENKRIFHSLVIFFGSVEIYLKFCPLNTVL